MFNFIALIFCIILSLLSYKQSVKAFISVWLSKMISFSCKFSVCIMQLMSM